MANPVAYKAKGTKLYITISATLTAIPGLENVKINPGENQTFENGDLDSSYLAPVSAGIRGEGSFTADVILDPLSAVHQACHIAFNAGTEQIGKVVLGASAKEISCKFVITKWETNAERGNGLKASMEGKFTEAFVMNES